MHYRAYDIRHRLVQADTKRLLHRNAPHRDGDRYVVVLFNKDLNYKGTARCARSTAIRTAPPIAVPRFTNTREGDAVERARAVLMGVLRRTRLPVDRCGDQAVNHPKYSGQAHLLSFGISQSRKSRRERAAQGVYTRVTVNANNRKYAALYDALCAYLDALAPGVFGPTAIYHACIISKNSQCKWHRDKSNIGHAALTARQLSRGCPPHRVDYTINIPLSDIGGPGKPPDSLPGYYLVQEFCELKKSKTSFGTLIF